jgi:phage baseplate assembly protein W
MATFIGFNTQKQYKKFTLTDTELIKRDLLNALNILQGQLPGRPTYGTTLWNILFENQSPATTTAILAEIQRVAAGDPRLNVTDVNIYPQENGVLIEIQIQFVPNADAQLLSVFFDQQQRIATFS